MNKVLLHVVLVAVLGELLISVWAEEPEVRHHLGKKCVVKRRNSTRPHAPKSHTNPVEQIFLREPKIKEDTSDVSVAAAPGQSGVVSGAPGQDVVVRSIQNLNEDEQEVHSTSAPSTTSTAAASTSDTQGQFFGMASDDFDSDTLTGSATVKSASQASTTTTRHAPTTSSTTTTKATTTTTAATRLSSTTKPTRKPTTASTIATTATLTAHKLSPVQLEGSTRPQPFRDHAAARVTNAAQPTTKTTPLATTRPTTQARTRRTTTTTTEAPTTEVTAATEAATDDRGVEIDESATKMEVTSTTTTTTTTPSTIVTSASRKRPTKARTQSKATTTSTTEAPTTVTTAEALTTEAFHDLADQDVPSALETADKEKRAFPTRKPIPRTPRFLAESSQSKNVLLDVAEVADKDDTTGLQRVNGPGTPLLDGSYLSDPWMCRVNKSVVRSPVIMKTCQGVEKQIVDLRVYKLAGIPIEECVTTPVILGDRCTSLNGGRARCAQRYVRYGLIAKDLDSDKKAHECFRFPSACLCQIILANTADTSAADDVGQL